jgi:hypothetical protein
LIPFPVTTRLLLFAVSAGLDSPQPISVSRRNISLIFSATTTFLLLFNVYVEIENVKNGCYWWW